MVYVQPYISDIIQVVNKAADKYNNLNYKKGMNNENSNSK